MAVFHHNSSEWVNLSDIKKIVSHWNNFFHYRPNQAYFHIRRFWTFNPRKTVIGGLSGHVTNRCLAPSRSLSASLRSATAAVSPGHYTVNHCTPTTAGRQLFHYGRQEKPNQVPNLFVSFRADQHYVWFICNNRGWLVDSRLGYLRLLGVNLKQQARLQLWRIQQATSAAEGVFVLDKGKIARYACSL